MLSFTSVVLNLKKKECFTSTKSTITTMFATEVTQQYYIYFEDSGYDFTLRFI